MNSSRFAGCLLAGCALLLVAPKARAQIPCSTSAALADSARSDFVQVMESGSPLVAELRKEQRIEGKNALADIRTVTERYVCARIAAAFSHVVAPGVAFPVLRVGPLLYARDPDQKRGTGVITDTTFKVLLRLGPATP